MGRASLARRRGSSPAPLLLVSRLAVQDVLVFDEIQTLPINCVHLFNNAINFLVEQCGSTVVLCTATQPLLDQVNPVKGAIRIPPGHELMPDKSSSRGPLRENPFPIRFRIPDRCFSLPTNCHKQTPADLKTTRGQLSAMSASHLPDGLTRPSGAIGPRWEGTGSRDQHLRLEVDTGAAS